MLSSVPFEVPPYLRTLCRDIPAVSTAVAGADHPIAMESAYHATKEGLIEPVLVGDRDRIRTLAHSMKWDLAKIRIIHAPGEAKASSAAVTLAKSDEVAAIMKGQVHTNALMSATINKETGLRIGRRLSHIFHMTVPGKEQVLMITDGAVNVAPNLTTKIDIVKNSIDLAHVLGNGNPKVALLSGTETPLTSMPSSVEAAEIVKLTAGQSLKDAIIDGPFAFDTAISPEAARVKKLNGPVAGNADILVVPNIEAGNGLFKMMVYFMSAVAAGVVMGAKVPIMLTSRADPPQARVASAALAALVAAKSTPD